MSVGMIVVFAIVLITVVLSAVLYISVINRSPFMGTTPLAVFEKSNITNGVQMTIVTISNSEVSWGDVTVQLTDGTNFAEWSPRARDLDDDSATSLNLTSTGATALGDIDVYCWVFDLNDWSFDSGYGVVSSSDYIRVFTAAGATTFSSATTYTLVLIYEPTSGMIDTVDKVTGERSTGISFTG